MVLGSLALATALSVAIAAPDAPANPPGEALQPRSSPEAPSDEPFAAPPPSELHLVTGEDAPWTAREALFISATTAVTGTVLMVTAPIGAGPLKPFGEPTQWVRFTLGMILGNFGPSMGDFLDGNSPRLWRRSLARLGLALVVTSLVLGQALVDPTFSFLPLAWFDGLTACAWVAWSAYDTYEQIHAPDRWAERQNESQTTRSRAPAVRLAFHF